jgi:hypothetical protein
MDGGMAESISAVLLSMASVVMVTVGAAPTAMDMAAAVMDVAAISDTGPVRIMRLRHRARCRRSRQVPGVVDRAEAGVGNEKAPASQDFPPFVSHRSVPGWR